MNNQQGPEWKLWEQPEDYPSRGRNAFRSAKAARRQGAVVFDTFHMALLKARHEESRDISDMAVLTGVAESSGLDMDQFLKDFTGRQLLVRLAEDHTYAEETLHVFGTPTLVFPEQQAVFLKMAPPPSLEKSVAAFAEVRTIAEDRLQIREIKRP